MSRWLTVLLTGLLLAVTVRAAEDPGPDRWIALGNDFLEQGVYREALRAFDSAADASGRTCVRCETGAAIALLGLGRHEEAVERARRAVATTDGDTRQARILLGRALLGSPGSDVAPLALAEARTLFGGLLDEGVSEAGLFLGEVLTRLGREADALKTLEAYLESDPEAKGLRRARQLIARPYCARRDCLPPFAARTLDGAPWDNDRLAGRVVLLDFWTTWCEPCVESLPALKQLSSGLADKPFTLISFSADSDPDILRATIETHNLDWPQIWDPDGATIKDRFGVRHFPTYIVVDTDGVVRGQYSGGRLELGGKVTDKIEELLEGGS